MEKLCSLDFISRMGRRGFKNLSCDAIPSSPVERVEPPISSNASERGQPPRQPRFIFSRKFVFPNPQDTPAIRPQGSCNEPVTRDIARKLLPPKGAIVPGFGFVFGTAMPETTVHKNRQLEFEKNKIRADPDSLSALGRGLG